MSKLITPSIKQSWCASGVLLAMLAQGVGLGVTSNLLHALQGPNSPIKLDVNSASSFAAIVEITDILSTIASCILMDLYGRRLTCLLSIIPGMVGWPLTYLAQNYTTLVISRLMFGASLGSVCAVTVVVLAEYPNPQYRGMFLNLKMTFLSVGNMIAHILGNFLDWRTIALTIMLPHVLAFLIACTVPESPSWLAAKKQFEKCEREFIWLRGSSEESKKELKDLVEAQRERLLRVPNKINFLRQMKELLQKFIKKDFLKPFAIAFTSYVVFEASGKDYFASYALQIVSNVTEAGTNPYYYALYTDIIITIASIFSSILIRIMKRRILYFSTGIGSLLVLTLLCSYLYLVSNNVLSKNQSWIMITLFLLYFFITNLGCTPMMVTIHGEIFPVAHRASAQMILGVIMSLCLAGILKVIPYLIISINVYGMFAVFGIIIAVMLLILYFILPETKDRTLQEIENYFTHGKFSRDSQKEDEVHLNIIS